MAGSGPFLTLCGEIKQNQRSVALHELDCPICIKRLQETGDQITLVKRKFGAGEGVNFNDEYMDWEDPTKG